MHRALPCPPINNYRSGWATDAIGTGVLICLCPRWENVLPLVPSPVHVAVTSRRSPANVVGTAVAHWACERRHWHQPANSTTDLTENGRASLRTS
jgi:hypothetical protein